MSMIAPALVQGLSIGKANINQQNISFAKSLAESQSPPMANGRHAVEPKRHEAHQVHQDPLPIEAGRPAVARQAFGEQRREEAGRDDQELAMTKTALVAIAAGGLLVAASAQALTLTNRDLSEHWLQIYEGEEGSTVLLQPGQTKESFCLSGCTIMLDEDEVEFAGDENVAIERGTLVINDDE
jgi:hypothetical protein